jgi:hypothetical protein
VTVAEGMPPVGWPPGQAHAEEQQGLVAVSAIE